MSDIKPPGFIRFVMSRLCHPYIWESAEGDLFELFQKDLKQGKSRFRANMNYTRRSFAFMRFRRMLSLFTSKAHFNTYSMFKFLFRISARNLLKHKMVSVMSLLTLVVGAVSFQLVYAWIDNEASMDVFHEKADQVHIGTANLTPNSNLMAGHIERLFGLDYAQYPEIEQHVAIHNYQPGEIQFISAGRSFDGTALISDSAFFDLFSFPTLLGDPKAIHDPTSILVTEQFAKRVWGEEYPIGKRVEIKCDQEGVYQVAAVLQNIPSNSSLYFDYLIPRHSKNFWRRMPQDLILLSEGASIEDLNDRVNELVKESRFKEGTIAFLPLTSIYHEQPFSISLFAKYGDRTNYLVMQIVAFALLLITIFGFTNIQSTALLTMTKKLGVKRVIGAQKRALIFEVIVNMFLYFLIAAGMAFVTTQMLFESYTETMELHLDHDLLLDLKMISLVIGMAVFFTTMIQVFKLRGINALQALSGKVNFFKAAYRQKVITSIQYAVAISLLIATAMIYLQINFMLNKETGLNQENIVQTGFFEIIPSARQDSLERERLLAKYRFVRNELDRNPDITAVSHGQIPLDYAYANSWKLEGSPDDYLPVKTLRADPTYQQVFDLEVLSGRFFNDSLDRNGELKVVINEAAMKHWGIKDLKGARIEAEPRGRAEVQKYQIIGIVKDFHYEHLSQAIQPLVMPYFYFRDQDMLIRYAAGKEQETLSFLEELYQKVNEGGFIRANRFEEQVSQQYLTEKKTNKIYLSFGMVTLFLSCISMFTFTFHETKRRTKEIGIRKVNGASIRDIFQMLGKSFLTTIGLAFLVACPVVWHLMDQWLDNFANRIHLEWWVFLMVGSSVALMALLVISWHVLKVARINPVDTLRYE